MSVSAIPKGRNVWCPHASREGAGCSIYADRPAPCRDWSCAWLLGHPAFLESDKPDRIGVVASVTGPARISLNEGRPGALEGTQELVGRLVALGETVTLLPVSGRPTVVGVDADSVRREQARAERRRR